MDVDDVRKGSLYHQVVVCLRMTVLKLLRRLRQHRFLTSHVNTLSSVFLRHYLEDERVFPASIAGDTASFGSDFVPAFHDHLDGGLFGYNQVGMECNEVEQPEDRHYGCQEGDNGTS